MSFAELKEQVLALNEADRAQLAGVLYDSLPADYDVSDEEVLRREAELDSGTVQEISREEFTRRFEAERGR
jgi:hypothetical protein